MLLRKEKFKTVSSSRMTVPIASVIEVDIETSKDIGKELLIGVKGFCQTDTRSGDRVGRQGCQEGCRVRVVL